MIMTARNRPVNRMQVHLVRPDELGPAEIAAWQAMQRATPSLTNPFLSPEFAMTVGRFRPGAQVAILTEGQSVTGFFPFQRRRLGVGLPICGWLTPCQGLVNAPGAGWDPQELLRGCRLSAWQFDNLITSQWPFKPYHSAVAASAVIDLSDGFDAYYAKLRAKSPRFCREIARRTRKLAREVGEIRVVADSADASALHMLMAWKSQQYRRTSHVDRFEQPWLVGLFNALLATRGDYASGLLSVLYADGQPIAAQFSLRTRDLVVGWFTGYDPRFRKYSPGLVNIRQMVEEMAADGISTIDMGAGAKNYYKEALKSHDVFVAKGVVTSRSMLGASHRARVTSRLWASRAVHQRPGLHHAADRVLRRSGVARRVYGRVLQVVARRGSFESGRLSCCGSAARVPERAGPTLLIPGAWRGSLTLGFGHVAVRRPAGPLHDGLLAALPDRRHPHPRCGLPGHPQARLDRRHHADVHRRDRGLAHRQATGALPIHSAGRPDPDGRPPPVPADPCGTVPPQEGSRGMGFPGRDGAGRAQRSRRRPGVPARARPRDRR
jgi:CelD/BcsL family acetyltransferase involved in cellulose biosynthesis